MKRISFLIIFQIVFLITVSAHKAPIKWGNVAIADLQLSGYANDLQAPAAVLCDYGTVEVGPRTEYTRHVRIKIFKSAGIRYGTIEIPYKSYDRYEVFSQISAQTFNLNEKGEIVKTKLKGGEFKEEIIDSRHKKMVFTCPDLKPGSVIEYRYTIRSLDLVRLENWYFQTTIPTVLSQYVISIPRRFSYLVTFQKGKAMDIDEQQAFAQKIQWLYSSKIKQAKRELSSENYLLYGSPKGTTKVYFSYGETMYFKMKDVPALKPVPEMYAFSDYYPTVKAHLYYVDRSEGMPFYYRTILDASRTDYASWNKIQLQMDHPTGYILYWLPTWSEFNEQWLKDERLGGQLSKAVNYKQVLDTISEDSGNDYKTLEKIYTSVKSAIEWNGVYSMYASNDLKKVIKSKSGTSGEINILFISLLRRAGFEVYPILVRTKNLGRIENMYPVSEQFNHVIAQVGVNGIIYYIDVCNNSDVITQLPGNIDDTDGWLLKKENYGWIHIQNKQRILAALSIRLPHSREFKAKNFNY